MEVANRLPGIGSLVHNKSKAVALDPLTARDLIRGCDQTREQFPVVEPEVGDRFDVLVRDDEYVGRRLRPEVAEGRDALVAVDDLTRQSPGDDSAEHALAHPFSHSTTLLYYSSLSLPEGSLPTIIDGIGADPATRRDRR